MPQENQAGNDDVMVSKLAEALVRRMSSIPTTPAIPLAIDLWDIDTIAAYLKRDPQVVRERIACLPEFPKAIRLPSGSKRGGHPLYKAKEIIAWAEGYQDGVKHWRKNG